MSGLAHCFREHSHPKICNIPLLEDVQDDSNCPPPSDFPSREVWGTKKGNQEFLVCKQVLHFSWSITLVHKRLEITAFWDG